MKPDLQLLVALARDARVLSTALVNNKALPCTESTSCITKEAGRKRSNGNTRSFHAFDPERLCGACRSYWFAEMAVQTLERELMWVKRTEAERAVTSPPSYEEAQPTTVEFSPEKKL
jgi:hypothetical protein